MESFESIVSKNQPIYVLNNKRQVEKYDLSENPKGLFDINKTRFSNGWGESWNYSDYGTTWSFDELDLLKKNYNNFAKSNDTLKQIERAVLAIKDDVLLAKVIRAKLEGFYGTMYGGPMDEIVHISSESDVTIGLDGNLWYIWGWPGPDCNKYEYTEYGITWALTKEEFKNRSDING